MDYDSIVPWLFLATFVLALAFGLWQWFRASKARREHHRSAAAEAAGEPRTPPR